MRIEICVLLALLPTDAALAGGDPGHRLAGIVELDNGARQAWIVTSSGEERVFRVGDAFLGDGRISQISKRSVRVQLADRELILQLAGGAAGSGAPGGAHTAPMVESRAMSGEALRRILIRERAAGDGPSAVPGQPAAASVVQDSPHRHGGRPSATRPASAAAGDEVRQQLNAALGLPGEARIVAVDERAVASPLGLAEELAEALDRGEVPRLTVEGGAGVDEIYVFSEDAPHGALD
jgi:hypothetical protein